MKFSPAQDPSESKACGVTHRRLYSFTQDHVDRNLQTQEFLLLGFKLGIRDDSFVTQIAESF